jgi:endonuclease YncB( thermonuclease family)
MRQRQSGRIWLGSLIALAITVLVAVAVISDGGEDPRPDHRAASAGDAAGNEAPIDRGQEGGDRHAASRRRPRQSRAGDDNQRTEQPEREKPESEALGIPDRTKRTTVVSITDGDTVELAGIGASRLIGVDTPEVYFGGECYGEEASAFASRLMTPGETVYYLPGVERVDDYGRDLVYLWLAGGTFFNAALVKEGYAAPLTIPPNVEYAELFRRLAADARRHARGLWSPKTCGGDTDKPVGGGGGGSGGNPDGGGARGVASAGGAGSGCESGYSPCVPTYPPDVDCADLNGTVAVTGSDRHGLDANGDGAGCE